MAMEEKGEGYQERQCLALFKWIMMAMHDFECDMLLHEHPFYHFHLIPPHDFKPKQYQIVSQAIFFLYLNTSLDTTIPALVRFITSKYFYLGLVKYNKVVFSGVAIYFTSPPLPQEGRNVYQLKVATGTYLNLDSKFDLDQVCLTKGILRSSFSCSSVFQWLSIVGGNNNRIYHINTSVKD